MPLWALSAETESLVKLINELPAGCIDYIGAGPLHVSTTKPEASVGGNDGSGHTLDEAQINAICDASDFPVVVGGGVTANDMEMLAHSRRPAGLWCRPLPAQAIRKRRPAIWFRGWKAVRGDAKHGHVLRK